jgi:hypothetical protein
LSGATGATYAASQHHQRKPGTVPGYVVAAADGKTKVITAEVDVVTPGVGAAVGLHPGETGIINFGRGNTLQRATTFTRNDSYGPGSGAGNEGGVEEQFAGEYWDGAVYGRPSNNLSANSSTNGGNNSYGSSYGRPEPRTWAEWLGMG